ncbi:MAG: PcfJ domain-containing protein, partial [Schwartzia sp.]|nr:PcfJ domain-containing protein [Schwartzia sp. (in: firmicutes)]
MKIEGNGFQNHGLPPESKEIMRHFGNDAFRLNDHEKRFMRMNAGEENYFIMETREDRGKGRGWCSTCRKTRMTPEAAGLKHNDKMICPHCGKRVTVKHSWRLKYAIDDDSLFYLYRPSVIDPAVVTARAVYMYRVMPAKRPGHDEDFKFSEKIFVDSFYIFEPGKGATHIMPSYNSRIDYYGWYRDVWKIEYLYKVRKGASPRDYYYQGTYRGYCRRKHNSMILADIAQAFEAAKDSPIKYGMKEYCAEAMHENFLRFWGWRAKYSSVEKLLKIGLGELVHSKIMGESGRAINWRGATLTKILRKPLTKEDKKFLLKHGDYVDQTALEVWQRCPKISIKTAVWLGDNIYNLNEIFNTVGKRYEDAAVDYLIRQYRKSGAGAAEEFDTAPNLRVARDIISDYRDYLRMTDKNGQDIHNKSVMCPKNLKRAHDEAMKDYEAKKNEEKDKALREQLKRYKKYQYSAMGCVVVAPRSCADIVEEGIMQHNCVASYIDSVTRGECDIVFVRRVGDEATS